MNDEITIAVIGIDDFLQVLSGTTNTLRYERKENGLEVVASGYISINGTAYNIEPGRVRTLFYPYSVTSVIDIEEPDKA